MKFKITSKIVCVDSLGSNHLERNKEYIVVDINKDGNLGLRDPSLNCLLPHYYKPSRFTLVTPKTKDFLMWVCAHTGEAFAPSGPYQKEGWTSTDGNYIVRKFTQV